MPEWSPYGEERALVDARRIAVLRDTELEPALRRILPAGFLACSIASAVGLFTGELWLVAVCAPGALAFSAAWLYARKGALRSASWVVVLTATALVTVSATIGEGLGDSSIIAFPVILMFAAMTLDLAGTRAVIRAVVASMLLIAGDQLFSWVPYSTPANPAWADAIIVGVIMTATMFAVAQLTTSARRGLATAQIEIELRRRAEDELRVLSTHDYLTGVFNRRFFDAELARLASSRAQFVSVIVADLDDLKTVNDRFGHAAGDRHLAKTARLLRSAVRAEDVLARIGGDEFAILLPDADHDTAEGVLERIEQCVAEQLRDARLPAVRLSIGSATAMPGELDWAVAEADARMYASKRTRKSG